jgi:hypothetical protein
MEHRATVQNNGANKTVKKTNKGFLLTIYQKQEEGAY